MLSAALDEMVPLTAAETPTAAFDEVVEALNGFRATAPADDWSGLVLPAARAHSVAEAMQECPLTRHSFTRPRGYPGDAGLLDFIYNHNAIHPALDAATPRGRAIYAGTSNVPACRAARERRRILGERIDAVALDRPGAEVLVVACGHLREAEMSAALREGRIGRLVATDQDPESLKVVEGYRDSVSTAIETRKLSVRNFISSHHDLASYDLVYAAGLYDYLDDRIAARLTRKLFSLLKPGGRLLLANYKPGLWELSYMEAFMDWNLIYRTEDQIHAFAGEISDIDIASRTYFEDSQSCIGYLELARA